MALEVRSALISWFRCLGPAKSFDPKVLMRERLRADRSSHMLVRRLLSRPPQAHPPKWRLVIHSHIY
jgi:hypothetical protein